MKDLGKLVKKQITDKTGKHTTVWVKTGQGTGKQKDAKSKPAQAKVGDVVEFTWTTYPKNSTKELTGTSRGQLVELYTTMKDGTPIYRVEATGNGSRDGLVSGNEIIRVVKSGKVVTGGAKNGAVKGKKGK